MVKRVSIPLSKTKKKPDAIDDWVTEPSENKEITEKPTIKTKRFTFDMPQDLHTQLKIKATESNITMGEMLITAIEKHLKKLNKK